MFPPNIKEFVSIAHEKFLKELASSETTSVNIPFGLSAKDKDTVDLMKILTKFTVSVISEVVTENNRLLIEKLKEKGIEL